MSEIAKILGKRIRNYRTAMGLSQEKLAELSGCHHTYIGQIERGEKNATVESIEKISTALGVPLSKLFEMLGVAYFCSTFHSSGKSFVYLFIYSRTSFSGTTYASELVTSST
ncbi:MAG: helix-turn-helix transcriptional regulator [Clostridia bacterium]|nr:helix-turn-helix transcriptional regulator [Clostridia bacterium]